MLEHLIEQLRGLLDRKGASQWVTSVVQPTVEGRLMTTTPFGR